MLLWVHEYQRQYPNRWLNKPPDIRNTSAPALMTKTRFQLQRAKSKMVLEHLVVSKAARADKLEQATLDDILRYGAQELFNEDSSTGTQAPDGQQQQQQQQQTGGDQPGSGSGKQQLRIVWDDAALERLLDRSQLGVVADAAEAEEEEEDDFSKAFKVHLAAAAAAWQHTCCMED